MPSITKVDSNRLGVTNMKIPIWFWRESSDNFASRCLEVSLHKFWTSLRISARLMQIAQPSFGKQMREYFLSCLGWCLFDSLLSSLGSRFLLKISIKKHCCLSYLLHRRRISLIFRSK